MMVRRDRFSLCEKSYENGYKEGGNVADSKRTSDLMVVDSCGLNTKSYWYSMKFKAWETQSCALDVTIHS